MRRPAEVGAEAREHVVEVGVGGARRSRSIAPRLAAGGASSSASISSSAASGSLRPRASKNLTPLYSGGLCEAEMTTPRSSDAQARPPASAARRRARRSRRPRRPRARTPPRAPGPTRACRGRRRRARAPLQSVAARPSRSTRSAVRNSPTTPRTPSVPKYRRAIRGRLVIRKSARPSYGVSGAERGGWCTNAGIAARSTAASFACP